VTWIFCPGHAGVLGNEQADKLAGLALVKEKIQYDKKNVIKVLWDKVWSGSDQVENLYVDRMKLLDIMRGSGRYFALRGKTRFFNQCATGTISMTFHWLLNRGTENVWVCPECNDVDSESNLIKLHFHSFEI